MILARARNGLIINKLTSTHDLKIIGCRLCRHRHSSRQSKELNWSNGFSSKYLGSSSCPDSSQSWDLKWNWCLVRSIGIKPRRRRRPILGVICGRGWEEEPRYCLWWWQCFYLLDNAVPVVLVRKLELGIMRKAGLPVQRMTGMISVMGLVFFKRL